MIVKQEEQASLVKLPVKNAHALRRGIQIRFSERRVLLFAVDSIIVLLTVWFITWFWQQTDRAWSVYAPLSSDWILASVVLLSWWVLALLNDLYDVPTSHNVSLTLGRLAVVGGTYGVLIMALYFVDSRVLSLSLFLYFLVISLPAIALWRWLYAISTYQPPFVHRILVIGGGERGRAVVELLNAEDCSRCTVVGFLDDEVTNREIGDGIALLGKERELPALAMQLDVHEVIVAKERDLGAHLFDQLVDCQAEGLRVSWVGDLYGRLYRQTPVQHIDPAWVLQAMEDRPIFSRLQQVIKRLLDIVVVVLALPVILLIMVPLAILIRLDSPGPAFYRQTRAGRGCRPFSIVKFRTMSVDAEGDGRARWAEENDPRITRVGRILRKTRLDELPQILNVLHGEMSLVGPRPERPEFIESLQKEIPFYRTRLMVKPGITGWAQVQYDYGSSSEDALKKLQYDFYYIQYWSLWMDLYILYRTFGVMVMFKGR